MKNFKSNSELCKAWVNNTHNSGKANNMFFENDTIYSYGYHYQIAKIFFGPNGDRIVFINSNGYSTTTARHTRHVLNTIPDGIHVFKVPFKDNRLFSIEHSDILEKLKILFCHVVKLCSDQLKARKSWFPFFHAQMKFEELGELCRLFNIDPIKVPSNWAEAFKKYNFLRYGKNQSELVNI